jgi:hypothetical protein
MNREALIKSAIAAVNARDVDASLACCTDDTQLYTPNAELIGPYQGPSGIQRFVRDIDEASPDFQLELERVELVGERALALVRTRLSGRASGVSHDTETAVIYDFTGDRIARTRVFSDRQVAVGELGLNQ